MADPRDELVDPILGNEPGMLPPEPLRLTVRPRGVEAPPITDVGWGSPTGAEGRPSGRLFEPDQSEARQPTYGERLGLPYVDQQGGSGALGGLVKGVRDWFTAPPAAADPKGAISNPPPRDATAGPRQMWQGGYSSPTPTMENQPAPVRGLNWGVNELNDYMGGAVEAGRVINDPGATPQQVDEARQQEARKTAGLTANLAGFGVTGASVRGGASAGVFGGRIEPARIAFAERLEAEGARPQEIWKQAGIARFADKQWRQEIPDLAASYRGGVDDIASRIFDQQNPTRQGKYRPDQIDYGSIAAKQAAMQKIKGGLVLEDVIPHHPELYGKYPELRQMPVTHDAFMEASGGYLARNKRDPEGRIYYREEPDPKTGKVTPRGLTFKTLIHEIDHAIANIEGFAKGANSDITNVNIAGSPARRYFETIVKKFPPGSMTPAEIQQAKERAASTAYWASAGENSAKIAEIRADMTPEQLKATYPGDMMQPKIPVQNVEYNVPYNPNAPQASMGSTLNPTPIEMQASSRPTPLMPPKSERKATGSLNPLDEADVTWKGKPMAEWKPQDWKEVGDHYGVKNLGPLSPVEKYVSPDGYHFEIPGGTKGTWTYYDLLHMKANPINPHQLPHELHAEMQRKLGRTMTPHGEVGQDQIWNGLMFGMTSASNPLFPNQLSASRLRLRDPKMLEALAESIPWKAGETVPKEVRAAKDLEIGQMFNLHEGKTAGSTGLGTRGGVNYTYIAELAQMFRKNPEWFRKKSGEEWVDFVERLGAQTKGLSMKTGSFSSVWQDPYIAAISAIDRHMAKEFERRGGLFLNPAEQNAWQDKTLKAWNKGKPADQQVASWNDLTQTRGFEGFMSEKLLEYVGAHSTKDFRNVKGEINPSLPKHLRDEKWFYEPKQGLQASEAYKRALAENQKAANEQGLNLFMSQWFEWDRIRQRFEPHENMFPGLSQMPAPSARQLQTPFAAHAETGHTVYDYGPTGRMNPTKKFPRNPSEMGYLGVLGSAGGAAGIGSLVDPSKYQPEAR